MHPVLLERTNRITAAQLVGRACFEDCIIISSSLKSPRGSVGSSRGTRCQRRATARVLECDVDVDILLLPQCWAEETAAEHRKLAPVVHPDKARQNGMSAEEAKRRFQLLQDAYSVPSLCATVTATARRAAATACCYRPPPLPPAVTTTSTMPPL